MKVFMIGGTGLLGSEAAKVLIARGHDVTAMALPPLPEGGCAAPGNADRVRELSGNER